MLELVDAITDAALVAHVDVAPRFSISSARGLLLRDGLPVDHGLLLSDPLRCIHTAGMRFPIDIVFLDRALSVVGVAANVAPWCLRWSRRGCFQLELAAGRAEQLGLRPGRRVRLRPCRASRGGQVPGESPHRRLIAGDTGHNDGAARCAALRDLPTVPPSAGASGVNTLMGRRDPCAHTC